jgi:methylated-DNA-[protein]-cysteine S-methyltransferase
VARIEYAFLDSPVGRLHAAVEDGALRVLEFADSGRRASVPDPSWVPDEGGVAAIRPQRATYFAGHLRVFDIDVRPAYGTAFQRRVWDELRRIPYGETISYGEQAGRLGDGNKSRAVGAANGKNPIPIVVPCHRVIGANGHLTGFGGGLGVKAWLLQHELQVRARAR